MEHYKTLAELHQKSGYPLPEHPLLSLLTCQELATCSWGGEKFTGNFYMIALKKLRSGTFLYGKTPYDHSNGSMSFVKPRQMVELSNIKLSEKSFVMMIHEDYLLGHPLHRAIRNYPYFDYETHEALHLSPNEEKTMWDLYDKMGVEYRNNPDEFSRDIILTHLDSVLKYAQRFYKRQFLNRAPLSGTTVTKFHERLEHYFGQGLHRRAGLPSVNFLAAELNLSPRYLSDLLKQETGKTAIDHIHLYLIEEAKDILRSTDSSIAEAAYQLGFDNPPYFTRLFKNVVGMTPNQFRLVPLN